MRVFQPPAPTGRVGHLIDTHFRNPKSSALDLMRPIYYSVLSLPMIKPNNWANLDARCQSHELSAMHLLFNLGCM